MGIFDLFKKLGKSEKIGEVVKERIVFSDIREWTNTNTKNNESKEKEVIRGVKDRIVIFTKNVEDKIRILQGFDVDDKKAEDKIKFIVKESRDQYVGSVETLLDGLNNLNEKKFEVFTKKVNKIFFDFNKNSFKNYEKATILIGKDMADLRGSLREFSKELVKIFENNQCIVDLLRSISIVESKLDNIVSIEGKLKIIGEAIISFNYELEEKEKENKRILREIENIKDSSNYRERIETQKKIESLSEESKRDILALKQLIDFKILASFFRINPEQMRIVKNHRDDFYTHFIKDNGKKIMDLLIESKMNNETISEKIIPIRFKREKMESYKRDIKEDETQELYIKLKEIEKSIDFLKVEASKEEKRDKNLRADKESLINSLKEELDKMNVEVV